MRKIMFLVGLCLMQGCVTRSTLPSVPEGVPLEARRWQLEIPAHDGTSLALTVWQPALKAEQRAPLLLHTHGLGLSRMKRGLSLYGRVLFTGTTARELWQQGYWLISWDQRGHGDSGGLINMMEPDLEVRDVSTILDWAEANLSHLARAEGDLQVGMIGESYGGAVQYLASVRDPRIDAIVPVATWYDLDAALAPADVPKGGWLRVLYLISDWWNWRKLPPVLREGFAQARQGRVPEAAREYLAGHELQAFCERGEYPGADALIIQGLRDVLFNPAQALAAQECFRQAQHEARLVVVRDAHLLPFYQDSSQVPGWALDSQLHCFDRPRETQEVVMAWLDEQLRDGKPADLPAVCVSPHAWGLALPEWPRAVEEFALAPVSLKGVTSRQRSLLVSPSRWLTMLRRNESVDQYFARPVEGGRHPGFIPVHIARTEELRVGTPEILLQGPTGQMLFAALVTRSPGSARLRRVHEQEAPVQVGERVVLPPVAIRLAPGEQLGVTLYHRSKQFYGGASEERAAPVSGYLSLPAVINRSADVLVQQ